MSSSTSNAASILSSNTNTAPRLSTPLTPSDYSDIINLPRPISKTHPRMEKNARAAQFAPYAALVGHHDLIAHEEQIANTKDNIDREITTELDPEALAAANILDAIDLEDFEPADNLEPNTDLDFSQENPLDN